MTKKVQGRILKFVLLFGAAAFLVIAVGGANDLFGKVFDEVSTAIAALYVTLTMAAYWGISRFSEDDFRKIRWPVKDADGDSPHYKIGLFVRLLSGIVAIAGVIVLLGTSLVMGVILVRAGNYNELLSKIRVEKLETWVTVVGGFFCCICVAIVFGGIAISGRAGLPKRRNLKQS